MMEWFKRNKWTVSFCALALCIGILAGYFIGGASGKRELTDMEELQSVGNVGQTSVLPTTEVTMKYWFLSCGHEIETKEVGGVLTGYTLKDITERYPDAKVTELSAERAVIEREIAEYCPEHYVLFENNNGSICVSRTNMDTLETEEVIALHVDMNQLSTDTHDALEEGLVFDTLEQINEYLEDVES